MMTNNSGAVPAEELADLHAMAEAYAAGRKPDPELLRRVRERADRATEAIFKRFGELDIAVKLIREGRDEE